MSKYSINSFLQETAQREDRREPFELENPYLLEVNLNGRVWAKLGSMIGYLGNVKFEREGMMEGGLGKLFKKAVTGESNPMMKAEGQGRVYFADSGKKVRVLYLQNETLFVNGNNVFLFNHSDKLIHCCICIFNHGIGFCARRKATITLISAVGKNF